jgi:hypothetical protein
MALSSTFGGIKLNDLAQWNFSGSGGVTIVTFPRAIGALVKPSQEVTRTITLTSVRFPIFTKTQIEWAMHCLNEKLIDIGKATLTVDGVQYTNAVPTGTSFNIIPCNEYFTYSLNFSLNYLQDPFRAEINEATVRPGYFSEYRGLADPLYLTCGFPIFANYEAGVDVSYATESTPRSSNVYGVTQYTVGGVENIKLECWIVADENQNFQRYIADWILDPLGRQGTLNLNGNVWNNAILTGVGSDIKIGESIKYNLEFQTTLAC